MAAMNQLLPVILHWKTNIMKLTTIPSKLRLKPGHHIIAPITDLDARERIIALITTAFACHQLGIPFVVACACRSMEKYYRRALGDSAVIVGLDSNDASVQQRTAHFLEQSKVRGAVMLLDGKLFQIMQIRNLIWEGRLPGVMNSSLTILVPVLADNVSLESTANILKLFPDLKVVFQTLHPKKSWPWDGYGVWNWPQRENQTIWDYHKISRNTERFIIRAGDEIERPPVTVLDQFLADNINILEQIDAMGIKGAIKYLESACESIYQYLLADITDPVADTNHESQPS